MKLPLVCAISATLLISSCATILNSGDQTVRINSNLPAEVQITNAKGELVSTMTAPGSVSLSKQDAPYEVVVSAQGYSTQTVVLDSKTTGSFWGNLIIGGGIGMIVDYINGTMWMLNNDSIEIQFVSNFN